MMNSGADFSMEGVDDGRDEGAEDEILVDGRIAKTVMRRIDTPKH